MQMTDDGKKLVQEFETMLEKAELKALSKVSLERPLSDKEFIRMKELAEKVAGIRIECIVQTLGD
jgi:hypothetical protein